MLIAIRVIVVPKIVVVALLVVVPFSTTTTPTSQWACAYRVRFCLIPVDKGLIFTLVANCPFNTVLLLWQERPHGKRLQGQVVKLSIVFQLSLGVATIVRIKLTAANIYQDVGVILVKLFSYALTIANSICQYLCITLV